jgi:hypothetical protein
MAGRSPVPEVTNNEGEGTMKHRKWATAVVCGALAAAIGLAACGGSDSSSSSTTSASTSAAKVRQPWNTASSAGSLKGICPNNIVIQTDWFPTPERAVAYELVGPNGKIDAKKGRYSGPFGNTGVNVEVRAGGPYTGFAPFTATMYQDRSIFFGFMPTDEEVQNFAKQPTVSVLATLDVNPQILMYDPKVYNFKSIADVGKSNAKVLYFEGLPFMDYLLEKGYLHKNQVDASFNGSPARFIASNGKMLIQGYVSNEPFRYEHDIRQWKRPVKSLLISDAGYQIYPENLAVRPDVLSKYPACLKKVVPMVQQAIVNYARDPQPTNDALLRLSDALKVPVPLTAAGNAFAVKSMLADKIISNGPNSTVGDFDDARVQRVIDDQLAPIFAARGKPIPQGLKAEQIHTNRFIDPSIRLGAANGS